MEAERAVVWLRAQDGQQPPEAKGEARDGLSLRDPEGASPADTKILDFWPPDL